MAADKDLFDEEQTMVAMSFGEHIEDLRLHLVRALLGLAVGVIITFVPPFFLGWRVMEMMQAPAQKSLEAFYTKEANDRSQAVAKDAAADRVPMTVEVPAADLAAALRKLMPEAKLPSGDALKGVSYPLPLVFHKHEQILVTKDTTRPRDALVSLAPLETMTIFFMVCIVTGLVIASPWVFYQIYAFVAAGLYRHERRYVQKFLPLSLGLFLAGVFLCFFVVLPVTLQFLLDFNVSLGIEPTLRISEWMSFATILPLIFGICFQTPLVMLILERIGIFTIDDFRAKRKIAILVMVVAAALITPTQDPFSMMLLAAPMILLYEFGIIMIRSRPRERSTAMAD
ncbi:MAG TPA: twin-arginine translocase subunit TatC [Isosphaeraceae bacterium]|jgi:sec-independent protein translocase protein TatC|nr:twin-arginine translocase subunit TatC [Isosphaeraceae bacterium]